MLKTNHEGPTLSITQARTILLLIFLPQLFSYEMIYINFLSVIKFPQKKPKQKPPKTMLLTYSPIFTK